MILDSRPGIPLSVAAGRLLRRKLSPRHATCRVRSSRSQIERFRRPFLRGPRRDAGCEPRRNRSPGNPVRIGRVRRTVRRKAAHLRFADNPRHRPPSHPHIGGVGKQVVRNVRVADSRIARPRTVWRPRVSPGPCTATDPYRQTSGPVQPACDRSTVSPAPQRCSLCHHEHGPFFDRNSHRKATLLA